MMSSTTKMRDRSLYVNVKSEPAERALDQMTRARGKYDILFESNDDMKIQVRNITSGH